MFSRYRLRTPRLLGWGIIFVLMALIAFYIISLSSFLLDDNEINLERESSLSVMNIILMVFAGIAIYGALTYVRADPIRATALMLFWGALLVEGLNTAIGLLDESTMGFIAGAAIVIGAILGIISIVFRPTPAELFPEPPLRAGDAAIILNGFRKDRREVLRRLEAMSQLSMSEVLILTERLPVTLVDDVNAIEAEERFRDVLDAGGDIEIMTGTK